jgi:hypothetical protein
VHHLVVVGAREHPDTQLLIDTLGEIGLSPDVRLRLGDPTGLVYTSRLAAVRV